MNAKLGYVILGLVVVIVLIYLFIDCPKSTAPAAQAAPVVRPEEGYREVADKPIGEIVLYYSPGCGYCKMFMPEWDKFEQRASRELPRLSVKKINCEGENGQMCFQKGIQGFPTVIMYLNNGSQVAFEKNRTADDLVMFVNENAK
jgi:thiol-disulfide isomerase/thioredoxin